jgi:uncharacterized protein (DUF433 family)
LKLDPHSLYQEFQLSFTWRRISILAYSQSKSSAMHYREIITIEPGKRSGKPCIRGMRITVSDVLSYLASGMTAQILADFPELTPVDLLVCLAFAADQEP